MEVEKIRKTLHGVLYNRNIVKIKEVKDFYDESIKKVDISKLNIELINEDIEVLVWIFSNPNYNLNEALDDYYEERFGFTNDDILQYLHVYYERILFLVDKFNNGKRELVYSDFSKD